MNAHLHLSQLQPYLLPLISPTYWIIVKQISDLISFHLSTCVFPDISYPKNNKKSSTLIPSFGYCLEKRLRRMEAGEQSGGHRPQQGSRHDQGSWSLSQSCLDPTA